MFSSFFGTGQRCELTLRASDPEKYALVWMDALFTDNEMAASCYTETKRSKK